MKLYSKRGREKRFFGLQKQNLGNQKTKKKITKTKIKIKIKIGEIEISK